MRERRACLSWITIVILLLACVTIQGVGITEASPGTPKVYVDPSISTAAPDETFNINITVDDIAVDESLYGWEFSLTFDPSVLNVSSHIVEHPPGPPGPPVPWNETVYHVYEGSFLNAINETLFIWDVNNTMGTVDALCMINIPFPPQGAVGSGVLVIIEFKVKAEGTTLLHFDYTELYTVIGEDTSPISHTKVHGFFEYPLKVHDIAVTNVTPSPASVLLGENVSVSVTVENQGTANETFDVTTYYNLSATEWVVIGTVNVTDLAPDSSETLNFTWNTAGLTPGTFAVKVEVPPVSGETDKSDNTAATDVAVLFHDIAITSVTVSHINVKVGDSVAINVTVANEGDFPETFNVTAYYFNETLSNVTVGTPQVLNLDPGASQVVVFSWNTTGVSLGTYTIKANATIPTGDTNATNNELIDGTVTVAEFSIVHHPVEVGGVTFHVVIESNSTLSNFEFILEEKKMGFNVTGSEGTVGFCNVTISNVLLGGPYTVQVDSLVITPEETTNGTHSFLYFTYSHSTQTVQIIGTTVATPPVALFTPSTTSAYVGDEITFNASASYDLDGTIVSYDWDFGDTKSGAGNVTSHKYASPGEYTVSLTVTDNDTLFDTATETITIAEVVVTHDIALEVGGVSFHVIIESNSTISNFQLISEIKEIRFDATGLSDSIGFCNVTIPIDLLGGPYTVQVDGLVITPEETTNGTHSFLYFTYNHSTKTVQIIGTTVATPPVALFTPSTTSAYVGDEITFNASASEDPDGEIVSYQWDFGDGTPITTETDPIVTHVYTSAATYPLTLTIGDNQGLSDTATGTVTVSAKHDVAVVDVTPFPSEVTVGKLVSVNVTVVNQGTETENFNITVYYDNTIIETKSVTNLASGASETLTISWETTDVDPGTYTIKAVAGTVTGETNITNNEFIDDTVSITVQEAPDLGIIPYVAAAGVAVTIIAATAFYFLRIRKPKPA